MIRKSNCYQIFAVCHQIHQATGHILVKTFGHVTHTESRAKNDTFGHSMAKLANLNLNSSHLKTVFICCVREVVLATSCKPGKLLIGVQMTNVIRDTDGVQSGHVRTWVRGCVGARGRLRVTFQYYINLHLDSV